MYVKTNSKTAALILLAAAVCLLLFACAPPEPTVEQMGQIYLYGEIHGTVAMYEKEFELWSDYYHDRGMRHLFLEYLESTGQKNTEEYRRVQENVEQGKRSGEDENDVYRENMLAENFFWEMERLDGADVMGIYGLRHAEETTTDWGEESTPSMAAQLREVCGEDLHTEAVAALVEPYRTETIVMDGKEYTAQYFGKKHAPFNLGFQYAEYWRLEDAYEDCKDKPRVYSYAAYNNWPIKVEDGQVFVIDSARADGSVVREFFRADGRVVEGTAVLDGFAPEAG